MLAAFWRRSIGRVSLAFVLLSLAACGGGGGSQGSDFSVQLDRSSIEFSYSEDALPAAQHVIATGSGNLPAGMTTLYVLAEAQGVGVDPAIGIQIVGQQADFSVMPAAGLAPGTYSGRIALYACTDLACKQRIGGTPLYVNYSVRVAAALKTTPTSLSVSTVGGVEASAHVQVQLPTGEAGFSASIVGDAPWLELLTSTATDLPLRFKPWRSGSYRATVTMASGTQSRTVPVTYEVGLPPGGEHDLAVSPAGLNFSTTENATAPLQTLNLSLPSWNATLPALEVIYEGTSTGWLNVSSTGTAHNVVASAATLSAGVYKASLVFTPPQPGVAVTVPVVLNVGMGLLWPTPQVVTVNAETLASDLAGSAPVDMAGGPALTWTAISNASWLVLQKASGTTGEPVTYAIDKSAVEAMSNYSDQTARITLRTSATNVAPASFDVVLSKRLPEVQWLGPYLLVSGQSSQMNVRGRGFNSVADVAARLHLPGLTATRVSRLSDTDLRVTLTPASAGQGTVSMGNALQLGSTGAALRVIAPQTYAYAAIPTGSQVRTVVLDAERRSVFAVNLGNESLTRFRHTGGATWVVDALPVPAIGDAGLAPDGSSVVVTSTSGRLRLVDPVNLSVGFTLDHSAPFYSGLTYVGFPIPATYDGRSWLAVGSTWNDLVYFDHAKRTMQAKPPGVATSFYNGPWMAGSRDGGRMLVVQSGSISPSPPLLAWETLTGALSVNPAGLTFSYDLHLSDDGSRAILDGTEVRDRDFGLVGRARLPSTHFGLVGAMAPDGQRAYVLGYPTNNYGVLSTYPTVFVFDTSVAKPLVSDLPLIAQFDLQHFPTCTVSDYYCNLRARAAISPDGGTLFYLGSANLVVAPIPASARTVSLVRRPAASNKTMQAQPWLLGGAAN